MFPVARDLHPVGRCERGCGRTLSMSALCPLYARSLSALCPLCVRPLSAQCPLRVRSISAPCPLQVPYFGVPSRVIENCTGFDCGACHNHTNIRNAKKCAARGITVGIRSLTCAIRRHPCTVSIVDHSAIADSIADPFLPPLILLSYHAPPCCRLRTSAPPLLHLTDPSALTAHPHCSLQTLPTQILKPQTLNA